MSRSVLAILGAGGLLACIPWLGVPSFYESILYLVCHWAVLALSWNILSGYSGYFSFGHGAFFGVGMYSTAVLSGKLNWPFLVHAAVRGPAPALLALLLGFVVFRVKAVRGELFALLTLAVTFVVATIILNTPVDGGPGHLPQLGRGAQAGAHALVLDLPPDAGRGGGDAAGGLSYKVQSSSSGTACSRSTTTRTWPR
jgi:branched-chain amino acid transport system permease protein